MTYSDKPAIKLRRLRTWSKRMKTRMKLWILSCAVFLTSIMFLPVIISVLLSSSGDLAFSLSKLWARIMLKAARVRVLVKNKEAIKAGQAYIIIANHQSFLDGVAIIASLELRFRWVAKKEILWVTLLGLILYISKTIFVDRSNTEKAVRSINKGFKKLPPKTGLIFFAEGTRSNDGKPKKFKKGAFVVAIRNDIPILPVTINGAVRLMPKGTIACSSGVMELVVSNPIETVNRSERDMEKLMEKTKEVIVAELNPDYQL